VADAFGRIRSVAPSADSLRTLLLQRADAVEKSIRAGFAGLARRFGTAIVAGTAFAAEKTLGDGWELRNRAYVFGKDGALLCTQDKVFLTEFERNVLGLSPGALQDARPFRICHSTVALTICRDTFHEEWEEAFRGVNLWIDLKANGTPFTEEERAGFGKALAARLPGARVRYGVTACLVGRFLDLSWEGESSILEWRNGNVHVLAASRSAGEPQIMIAELPINRAVVRSPAWR
jgi:predicted amidohydrolase